MSRNRRIGSGQDVESVILRPNSEQIPTVGVRKIIGRLAMHDCDKFRLVQVAAETGDRKLVGDEYLLDVVQEKSSLKMPV